MAQPVEAIVIGASAGGIEALSTILPALPPDFAIPVVIVLHIAPHRPSLLASVLATRCRLPVRDAEHMEPLRPATVYVAPPDQHLVIDGGHFMELVPGDRVNYSRPAIDVLFNSAAAAYGPAVVGVLLTGANDDGARGLASIGEAGGITVVQSPDTASSPTMPAAGLRLAHPQHVLPLAEMGAFLAGLDHHQRPAA